MTLHSHQSGLATVEFAIVGLWFLIVLFAVLEFGRLLYTVNILSETVRRAARVAVVCPINDPNIVQAAMFGGGADSALLGNLNADNLQLTYLDEAGAAVADPVGGFSSIRYVQASIVGYQHTLLIPMLQQTLSVPLFLATLPRESLGVSPEGVQCF